MSTDPSIEDINALDILARAVGDACRAEWQIFRLKGPEWLDIATAPQSTIRQALDTAYRLGAASRGAEE